MRVPQRGTEWTLGSLVRPERIRGLQPFSWTLESQMGDSFKGQRAGQRASKISDLIIVYNSILQ